MNLVRAKKHLGQHFLNDTGIARKIVGSLATNQYKDVLEVGPGMGVLTHFLIQIPNINLKVIEIDKESVLFLNEKYEGLKGSVINADFLKANLAGYYNGPFCIIGNFPYNISSQIFFKILDNHSQVAEVVGMVQKEVAERISSPPGKKSYGILSVLLQAYYNIDYLFTVNPEVFSPQPKVKSAVIRLTRNNVEKLECSEALFRKVVKAAFNQRRKMLRNSLKQIIEKVPEEFATLRPEQLDVKQFILLTRQVESCL